MENIVNNIYVWITAFGMNFIAAIAIIFFGRIVVGLIINGLSRLLGKRKVDPGVVAFTASFVKVALWAFIFLAALSRLGIQTASFIAVMAAAGLAVGLALQGSLSNFAAGFLIILLKPFRVGDFVEAGGVLGSVNRINIFNSVLKSPDNKVIIVPNSAIINGSIINYSAENQRRIDLKIGVSYSADIKQVKEVIGGVIEKHELILKDPAPLIRLAEMADSSLNFNVRVWSKTSDYWTVFYDLNEQIKEALDQGSIEIPFPQMDVHVNAKG